MKNWKDRYGNYFQYLFWKSVNPVLDGGGRGGGHPIKSCGQGGRAHFEEN